MVETEHAYADDVAAFRERRDELGWGPDGDPGATTAGYDPGPDVETEPRADAGVGPAD